MSLALLMPVNLMTKLLLKLPEDGSGILFVILTGLVIVVFFLLRLWSLIFFIFVISLIILNGLFDLLGFLLLSILILLNSRLFFFFRLVLLPGKLDDGCLGHFTISSLHKIATFDVNIHASDLDFQVWDFGRGLFLLWLSRI